MFENIAKFFKKLVKSEAKETPSKDTAKERLHLVLMQDRANVSADFLELMKQEIIEVIKKYIEVEEGAIDVRLTNEVGEDGTTGAPSLYANIPIKNIKNSAKKEVQEEIKEKKKEDNNKQEKEDVKIENEEKKEEELKNSKNELTEEKQEDVSNIEEEKKEEISEVIQEENDTEKVTKNEKETKASK